MTAPRGGVLLRFPRKRRLLVAIMLAVLVTLPWTAPLVLAVVDPGMVMVMLIAWLVGYEEVHAVL